MPACSVRSCKNRPEKGFRVFRIPKEIRRREIWMAFLNRSDITDSSCICEIHFNDDQYEHNRTDGRRLLRRDAIPTLLPPEKPVMNNIYLSNIKKNITKDKEHHNPLDDYSGIENLTQEPLRKKLKKLDDANKQLLRQLEINNQMNQKILNEVLLQYPDYGVHFLVG